MKQDLQAKHKAIHGRRPQPKSHSASPPRTLTPGAVAVTYNPLSSSLEGQKTTTRKAGLRSRNDVEVTASRNRSIPPPPRRPKKGVGLRRFRSNSPLPPRLVSPVSAVHMSTPFRGLSVANQREKQKELAQCKLGKKNPHRAIGKDVGSDPSSLTTTTDHRTSDDRSSSLHGSSSIHLVVGCSHEDNDKLRAGPVGFRDELSQEEPQEEDVEDVEQQQPGGSGEDDLQTEFSESFSAVLVEESRHELVEARPVAEVDPVVAEPMELPNIDEENANRYDPMPMLFQELQLMQRDKAEVQRAHQEADEHLERLCKQHKKKFICFCVIIVGGVVGTILLAILLSSFLQSENSIPIAAVIMLGIMACCCVGSGRKFKRNFGCCDMCMMACKV